jgi:AP2-associated kinase
MSHFPSEGATVKIEKQKIKVGPKIVDDVNSFIYKATDPSGRDVLLKVVADADKKAAEVTHNEFKLQDHLSSHPGILKPLSCSYDRKLKVSYILLEFCQTSLVAEMNTSFGKGFRVSQILDIFQSVCAAVHFMHTQTPPVVHRHLTLENIMMASSGWKIADCGSATTDILANYQDPTSMAKVRDSIERYTPMSYRAPEMVDLAQDAPIGPKADVWALGCILYKLCTFRDAFPTASPTAIVNVQFSWPDDLTIDPKLKELVDFMLIPDIIARPEVSLVLGQLAQSFPQFIDSQWTAFVPPKPADLGPKARARPLNRRPTL